MSAQGKGHWSLIATPSVQSERAVYPLAKSQAMPKPRGDIFTITGNTDRGTKMDNLLRFANAALILVMSLSFMVTVACLVVGMCVSR